METLFSHNSVTGRVPEGFPTLVDLTTTTITITWGVSTDEAALAYNLRIQPSGGTEVLVASVGLSTDTYQYTGLDSGTEYTVSLEIVGLGTRESVDVTTCKSEKTEFCQNSWHCCSCSL